MLRQMAPFWNAQLQGNVRLAQAFRKDFKGTMLKGFAFVTLAKLAEQAINWNDEDYWDRPQWERDGFFMLPNGKDENGHTKFARLQTPFEVGTIFGTFPGRVLQWIKQNDPEAMKSFPDYFLRQSVPNPAASSIQVLYEAFLSGKQGFNVFTGRPIVPDSLAELPPEMQWTEQTSRLAKEVGKQFKISPMKIDHVIGATTGGLGKLVTGAKAPFGRFTTTPLAITNQSTEDFYNTLTKLRHAKKRVEAGTQSEYPADKLKAFEQTARKATDLRREMRSPETDKDRKKELQEELYQLIRSTVKDNK
jgi:hypothetical protein